MDEHAHFNLRDAATLSGLPVFSYPHCDAGALEDLLERQLLANHRPLLLTDGAFATTGQIPPLAAYAQILESAGGRMFVDESHAFGVVGEQGRGAAEYCGVEHVASRGATLSKAYCTHGAIVGCARSVKPHLYGVPPIGAANAGSPLSAVAATASLAHVASHPELRAHLAAQTRYLRKSLRALGLEIIDSPAPIVAFSLGSRECMLRLQRAAFDLGIYLHYSSYIGAGPRGVIRCAVFADHTREHIDSLIDVLRGHL
jgi:7-keto-8-aminopelargonate synthetase-like enzyme